MSRGGGRDGIGGDRDGKNSRILFISLHFSYIHCDAFYSTFFFCILLSQYFILTNQIIYFTLTNQIIYFILLIRLLAVLPGKYGVNYVANILRLKRTTHFLKLFRLV